MVALDPPVWRALLDGIEADTVNLADIPPEKLAAPTIGAHRRQHGHTGMCEEARVLLAFEVVQEARRRVLLDRLEGIHRYLAVGGNPDYAVARLSKLVPGADA